MRWEGWGGRGNRGYLSIVQMKFSHFGLLLLLLLFSFVDFTIKLGLMLVCNFMKIMAILFPQKMAILVIKILMFACVLVVMN